VAGLILRRLVLAVFVVWGVTLITFFLSHVVPGDPARLIAGPKANLVAIAHIRIQYGLNLSLPQQYARYMTDLVHGNLGTSFISRRPVLDDLLAHFPATLELTLFALVAGSILAVLAALVAARRPGSATESGIQLLSVTSVSVPAFWAALILQLIVAVDLGWLPLTGRLSSGVPAPAHLTGLLTIDSLLTGEFATFVDALRHLVLPAIALGLAVFGLMARIMRASLLDVTEEDYVRTAEAKGLSESRVLLRHILRNALLPGVTVFGLLFGFLAGGIFVVEYIFAWPGIGAYAFNAFQSSDYNAVMGVTLVVAVLYVLVNLVIDLVYLSLDPRIRYT
jgi:peptide/nickel transport system permease protein